jgi:hypothetical protein
LMFVTTNINGGSSRPLRSEIVRWNAGVETDRT